MTINKIQNVSIYHESLGYITPISYYGKLSEIHSYVTEMLSTNPCGNISLFEFYVKFYNYIVNNIEFTFDLTII